MSQGIFRTATREAVMEIISESAQPGRFGLLLSPEMLHEAADKVVDLIETSLKLRANVQDRLERASMIQQRSETPPPPRDEFRSGSRAGIPKTRNASEVYENQRGRDENPIHNVPVSPTMNFRLPRKKIALSDSERENLRGTR
jgi:hypothetical protein